MLQHGGGSTTCVIVFATINYELFVGELSDGDTGNFGLVRQLILFNAFHCGYRFIRITLILRIFIIVCIFVLIIVYIFVLNFVALYSRAVCQ